MSPLSSAAVPLECKFEKVSDVILTLLVHQIFRLPEVGAWEFRSSDGFPLGHGHLPTSNLKSCVLCRVWKLKNIKVRRSTFRIGPSLFIKDTCYGLGKNSQNQHTTLTWTSLGKHDGNTFFRFLLPYPNRKSNQFSWGVLLWMSYLKLG